MLFPMQGKPESNRCYIYKLSMQMAKQAARQQANGIWGAMYDKCRRGADRW
jgi:hypothetical protein